MSRRIRVAALGPEPPRPPVGLGTGETTAFVREHLQRHWNDVLPDRPDLVVLPETCDIPWDWSASDKLDYVQTRKTDVLDFVRSTAERERAYIAYPTIRSCPDGSFRNSTYFLAPTGEILGVYDKNKPTVGELEDLRMRCGEGPLVVDAPFGRVGFVTCFDLNFPSLREGYQAFHPDLLLFSSTFHGGPLQATWALGCRSCFVAAVQQLPCSILLPTGETLATSTNYFDHVVRDIDLDFAVVHLDFNLDKLRRAKARYGDRISVRDPGLLGAVLLTSETEERTAREILEEFGIEDLDGYLARMDGLHRQDERKATHE